MLKYYVIRTEKNAKKPYIIGKYKYYNVALSVCEYLNNERVNVDVHYNVTLVDPNE